MLNVRGTRSITDWFCLSPWPSMDMALDARTIGSWRTQPAPRGSPGSPKVDASVGGGELPGGLWVQGE